MRMMTRQLSMLRWAMLLLLVLCHAQPSHGQAWLEATQWPSIPDAVGVAAPFAGVSGEVLIVAGGANFPDAPPWEGGTKIWHDRVYALTQAKGQSDANGHWRRVGKLPRALGYGVSITTNEGIICIGGSDATRHYSDVFRLVFNGKTVRHDPLPSLPRPIANGCGAMVGNIIYIAGGLESPTSTTALKTFYALDLSQPSPKWEELEPWPGDGRMLSVAGAHKGSFYLFSGTSLAPDAQGKPVRTYLKDAYRYDPSKGWTKLPDMPRPAVAAPSPAPNVGPAHLAIMGGDDGANVNFTPLSAHPGFAKTVLAYSTITDSWASVEGLAASAVTVPVVEWKGVHLITSGEIRPGVRSPAVWSFKPTGTKAGFGALNYGTLVVYLLAMVGLGSWFARRNKTTDDYFRGGQRIPWWAAGLSIFATMLSSITFMAIPAQSYSVGWNLYLANSYLILTPLVVLVFMPFYRRLNITSAYEYLELRFNLVARLIASIMFMLFQIGRITIVLYLPSLALATVSNLDIRLCITVMGTLVIIYSVLGGVEGVIWTDVAQSFVLMGGAIWALVTVMMKVEGGADTIITTASEAGRFFSSVSWSWDLTIGAGWVILVGSIFTNLFPYTASQDVVQRYVTTADHKSAAKAIWTNALVSPVAQAVFFAIGTALFAFYRLHPERLDPTMPVDSVFPQFIVRELPAGVAGLIVAGIFAAAQSTLSSSLNSVSSAYVIDIHQRFNPKSSDAACLKLARILTAVVGIVGTAAALAFTTLDIRSVWETFLGVIGLFGGTISGLFLLGIFTTRATARGAIIGAFASAALVFAVKFLTAAHFFCYPVVGVISCVFIGWLASLLQPRSVANLTGLTVYTLIKTGSQPAGS